MAKNNNYNNRGQRGQNRATASSDESPGGSGTRKIVLAIIALVIAAYVIISLVFGMWNPIKWNDARLAKQTGNAQGNGTDETLNGTSSGGSELGDFINNGIAVHQAQLPRAAYAANGVSEYAENAYTLTAEVLPDYASNVALDWSIGWQDSSSSWASGKIVTDYSTITPTADGANTAVLACLKDFGEPIMVTVSSRSNPEVCSVCWINYYQRVKSCNFKFTLDGEEVTPNVNNGVYKVDYTGADKDYTVELVPVYSNYTLTDTYITEINGALSSTFGYTSTESLNVLKVPAGLSGGDPELSQNALNWCNYVSTNVFEYPTFNLESLSIGRLLGLGNDTTAHGQTLKPKYKLTEEEKQHPRCAYYISLLNNENNFKTETAFNQTKSKYKSYQPSPYNYCSALISTYNDFVIAVKRCNDNNVGVIQYTVNISGAHSSFETVLNLGYNNEFKVNVQNINLSDTVINI